MTLSNRLRWYTFYLILTELFLSERNYKLAYLYSLAANEKMYD